MYVPATKHHKMIGWLGIKIEDVNLALYADVDYAGCGESFKSTSGARTGIQDSHIRFPLSGQRQGRVSHSTAEAEIVAADHAMSRVGLPAITLWEIVCGRKPKFVFYDDNQAMTGVVSTGKNPTMRHLEWTHGISIASTHDVFKLGFVSLANEVTAKMSADIHTKAFKDGMSWIHTCVLINIFPPEMLASQDVMDMMKPTRSLEDGSRQTSAEVDLVPGFPYTSMPILPAEICSAGLTSREGLQEHDEVDAFVVAKFPRMLRGPPVALPADALP